MADIAEIGYKADTTGLVKADKAQKKLSTSAKDVDKSTGKLNKTLTATNKRLLSIASGANIANFSLHKLASGAVSKLGKQLGVLAAGLISFTAFKVMINGAREFSKSLAELSTLLPVGSEQLGKMQQAARGMADEFGTNASFQIQAFYGAVSAGATDAAAATELVTAANRLAIGGITDVTTGVDILTTSTNAYALSGLTAADASDALFVGMKAGKTTIGQLASSLGNVIPIAASLGVEFDELVAGTSALTLQGLSTATSVTSLRAILSGIAKPTSEAAKMAKQLGIDFSVTALQSKGLAGFLADVVDKTGGAADKLSIMFGSVEALNAALAFAGAGGDAFNDILDQMRNKAGASDEAFEKVAGSLDARFGRAVGKLKNILVDFGGVLLHVVVPPMEIFAATLQAIGSAFKFAYGVGKVTIWMFTQVGNAIAQSVSPTSQFQTAVDNVTIALGDQLTQMQLLNIKMDEGRILTLAGAQAELNIAKARQVVIQGLIQQRREMVLSSDAYAGLMERINRTREELAGIGGGDVRQDRFDQMEGRLARLLVLQQDMLSVNNENSSAFGENLKAIELLEKAIANSKNGLVTFGAALTQPIESSGRLENNFAGIALQASRIVSALMQAPAALQGLEQQGAVLKAQIVALAAGHGQAAANAAGYREELEQQYGLAGALSMEQAVATSQIIDAQVSQFEMNERLRGQRDEMLSSLTSGAGGAATAVSELERIAEGFGALSEPFDQATAAFQAAETSFTNGIITNDEFTLSLARIQAAFMATGGSAETWGKVVSGQTDLVADKLESLAEGTLQSLGDEFIDLAIAGKANFGDLARSVIKDLIKMAWQAAIVKPLLAFLGFENGGTFGGKTGTGVASLKSANGNAFSGSNVVPFAKGGDFTNSIVNKSTPFSFAKGTALGEMGEAGPEAIIPLKRGGDGSLGVQMYGGTGGGANVNNSVEVNNVYQISGAISEEQINANIKASAEQTALETKQSLVGWLQEYEQNGTM